MLTVYPFHLIQAVAAAGLGKRLKGYVRFQKLAGCFVAASLFLAGCGQADTAAMEDAFEHVPPEIIARLCAELDARVDALAAGGAPTTIEDLPGWWPVVPREANAAVVYEDAVREHDPEERLRQIRAAAAMPDYAFPLEAEQLRAFIETYDIPWGQRTRESFRAIYHSVVTASEDGQCELAAADLEAGLAMLQQVSNVYTNMAVLVQEACAGLVFAAMEEALARCAFDEPTLASLQTAVQQLDSEQHWTRAIYVETLLAESVGELSPVMEDFLRTSHCLLSARAQVRLDLAATALAMHRYRLNQGAWPEQLPELVPDFLANLPNDPFSGSTILMSKIDNELYVHSVGYDGVANSHLPSEVDRHEEIYLKVGRHDARGNYPTEEIQ